MVFPNISWLRHNWNVLSQTLRFFVILSLLVTFLFLNFNFLFFYVNIDFFFKNGLFCFFRLFRLFLMFFCFFVLWFELRRLDLIVRLIEMNKFFLFLRCNNRFLFGVVWSKIVLTFLHLIEKTSKAGLLLLHDWINS
jgi:hypothetical protein